MNRSAIKLSAAVLGLTLACTGFAYAQDAPHSDPAREAASDPSANISQDFSTVKAAQDQFSEQAFFDTAKKLGHSDNAAHYLASELKKSADELSSEYVASRLQRVKDMYAAQDVYKDTLDTDDFTALETAEQVDAYIHQTYDSWTKSRIEEIKQKIDACQTIDAVYAVSLSSNYEASTINAKNAKTFIAELPQEQKQEILETVSTLENFWKERSDRLFTDIGIDKNWRNISPDFKAAKTEDSDFIKASFTEHSIRKIKKLNNSLIEKTTDIRKESSKSDTSINYKNAIVADLFTHWFDDPRPFYLSDTMIHVLALLDAKADELLANLPAQPDPSDPTPMPQPNPTDPISSAQPNPTNPAPQPSKTTMPAPISDRPSDQPSKLSPSAKAKVRQLPNTGVAGR